MKIVVVAARVAVAVAASTAAVVARTTTTTAQTTKVDIVVVDVNRLLSLLLNRLSVVVQSVLHQRRRLSDVASLAPTKVAILEHIIELGVERPEVALARAALLAVHLDETVVE